MGQYVYEILLPIPDIDPSKSQYEVDASKLLEYVKDLYAVTILQAEELLFCHRKSSNYPNIPMFVHRNVSIYTSEQYGGTAYYSLVIRPDKTNISLERDGVVNAYLRIVYTSMPEEGDSSYYGYNNYGGNIEEDFSNAVVIRLKGDYMSVQKVYFLGESIERINDNTYVYRNLSSAPNTTGTSISLYNNTGSTEIPKSAKMYLDGTELNSTKVQIKSYGVIDITTPLALNNYNTIEAIINL